MINRSRDIKIVDTHFHLGECRVFDLNVTEEQVVKTLNDYSFSAMIVQPFPGAFPQPPIHVLNKIYELSRKYENRIYGIVSINPHVVEPDEWKSQVRKWIKDYGFIGVKLHTIGHAVNLMTKDAAMIFQTADELEVPLMIHSGLGQPFASPAHVSYYAEMYPDLRIVLAHAGFVFSAVDAFLMARNYKNIYLETSWSNMEDIQFFIEKLGADKVMFGTDLPSNTPIELAKVNAMNLNNEQRDSFLYKTAEKVFKIKVP